MASKALRYFSFINEKKSYYYKKKSHRRTEESALMFLIDPVTGVKGWGKDRGQEEDSM